MYLHLAGGTQQSTPSAPAPLSQPLASITGPHSTPSGHTVDPESLDVDVLVYTENPAARFVLINMQRFGEGDAVAPETYIMEITATEVILNYRGAPLRLMPRSPTRVGGETETTLRSR